MRKPVRLLGLFRELDLADLCLDLVEHADLAQGLGRVRRLDTLCRSAKALVYVREDVGDARRQR